jgi:hypothetical protein
MGRIAPARSGANFACALPWSIALPPDRVGTTRERAASRTDATVVELIAVMDERSDQSARRFERPLIVAAVLTMARSETVASVAALIAFLLLG